MKSKMKVKADRLVALLAALDRLEACLRLKFPLKGCLNFDFLIHIMMRIAKSRKTTYLLPLPLPCCCLIRLFRRRHVYNKNIEGLQKQHFKPD